MVPNSPTGLKHRKSHSIIGNLAILYREMTFLVLLRTSPEFTSLKQTQIIVLAFHWLISMQWSPGSFQTKKGKPFSLLRQCLSCCAPPWQLLKVLPHKRARSTTAHPNTLSVVAVEIHWSPLQKYTEVASFRLTKRHPTITSVDWSPSSSDALLLRMVSVLE